MQATDAMHEAAQQHGITIRDTRFLRGPNLFAYMRVMQVVMDIGPYEDRPSSSFPGFTERLVTWLPGLAKHKCSVGRPGGFIERLRRGTYLGHICEHITLELQEMVGFSVAFGRARGTGEPDVYNVVISYEEEEPARAAFATALRLTLAAMHDEPFDIQAELEALQEVADDYRLGPSTAAIVNAARARRIPTMRVTETSSLVQLGYGVHQKRIRASETSTTRAIAVDICQDKPLTNQMLRAVGVPVPPGRAVSSADDAWRAAREIGGPVVVKPADGNQGKGVSVGLTTKQEVKTAYEIASDYSYDVLVERAITGRDYRLLVVNGKMVAAARRDPAHVVADGVATIRELVDLVNLDPRRRPGHTSMLTRIRIDEATELVLQQQGMTMDSVPPAGVVVNLRMNGNLSTGGTATDVTDEVHPANARVAELAARILDLDVAGIDMLCEDIAHPLADQDGAIVEVNAAPGLRMHLEPTHGQRRDVGVPIVEMLYPGNAPARIPIIAVTGTNGKTTVTRLIAHMYETARHMVGMTTTEGAYIGDERIIEGDCSGPRSARALLLHPRVEVAVLETARGGILREGLGFDWCGVGVVTNISRDHMGISGIETLEDLARVKQVVVENVHPSGAAVLNADDPIVAEMAAATDARVVYFSQDAHNSVVAAHLAAGGSAVIVEHSAIVLASGERRTPLVELDRVPFTYEGRIRFQVANALAAVAAAWAGDLNPALIARALRTFRTDFAIVPGRFNLMTLNGVEVVMDYGHNAAALQALGQAVEALGQRRTTLVMGLPGDRPDHDLVATIQATLPYVDAYVFHDSEPRGRSHNEVPLLLQRQLPASKVSAIASNEIDALERAWHELTPGERIIVIAARPEDVHNFFETLERSNAEDGDCQIDHSARTMAA
jgi:cyanophycin synthetase